MPAKYQELDVMVDDVVKIKSEINQLKLEIDALNKQIQANRSDIMTILSAKNGAIDILCKEVLDQVDYSLSSNTAVNLPEQTTTNVQIKNSIQDLKRDNVNLLSKVKKI